MACVLLVSHWTYDLLLSYVHPNRPVFIDNKADKRVQEGENRRRRSTRFTEAEHGSSSVGQSSSLDRCAVTIIGELNRTKRQILAIRGSQTCCQYSTLCNRIRKAGSRMPSGSQRTRTSPQGDALQVLPYPADLKANHSGSSTFCVGAFWAYRSCIWMNSADHPCHVSQTATPVWVVHFMSTSIDSNVPANHKRNAL